MTLTRFRRTIALLALVAPSLPAQRRESFITTLGHDTLAFEQFVRSGDSITGDWVTTYGGIGVHHYSIHLRPDGSVARYSLTIHRLGGRVDGTADLQFAGDSLVARGFDGVEQRLPLGDAVPTAAQTIAGLDLVVAHVSTTGQDSTSVPVVSVFGPYRRGVMPVARSGRDSVRLGNPLAPIWVTLDREGHISALSDRATCTREETRRVPDYDWHAIIARFPDIPDTAPLLGVPAISPRDSVEATLGAAHITIAYGRPAVRGREVFRHGVLGDTLWRLGANAPTQLVTSRDLVVGSSTLAAGTYDLSMRVAPDDSSFTVVFSAPRPRQASGPVQSLERLRVPVTRRALRTSVERLTIRIVPTGGGGSELRVEWGSTALTVPVRVN